MDALLAQAKQAGQVQDQTETTGGGFTARTPAEGRCPARFVGYIERGVQPQGEYQGKAKDPCMEVSLVFELFGKHNTEEYEVDGVKKKAGIRLNLFPMTVKLNDKAGYRKLFMKMRNDREDVTHMAQMLNEVFLLDIRKAATGKGREYYTFKAEDGSWNVSAPIAEKYDDEGDVVGTIDLSKKTPPASVPLQLFIFEAPTLEQWESIYIDGTYTKKDEEGNEVEHSKNFIQESIMESMTWEGSPMQALLMDLAPEEDEEEEVEVKKSTKKQTAKKSTAKSADTSSKKEEKKPASNATVTEEDEELIDDEEDIDALLGECGF